jgi:hypothetical protein
MAFVAGNVVAASLLQGALGIDDDHPALAPHQHGAASAGGGASGQEGTLVGEGMPGSISLFMVAWSLSYTAFHGPSDAAMAAAAAAAAASS